MKLETIILIGCIIVLFITVVYANLEIDNNKGRYYNCDLVEFQPDFPKEVKQKCRELRNENRSMQ